MLLAVTVVCSKNVACSQCSWNVVVYNVVHTRHVLYTSSVAVAMLTISMIVLVHTKSEGNHHDKHSAVHHFNT